MVVWTDFEHATIQDIFSKVDYATLGHQALTRYFTKFGNLYNTAAIEGNPNIAAHGLTVMHGLDKAVKNLDNIKGTLTELSVLHSEKLHVDPDNFRLLADCITIIMAANLGAGFTADVQAALQKFIAVVVSGLGKQYH